MIRGFTVNEVIFLGTAATWTIALTALAFTGGGIVGLIVMFFRISNSRILRLLSFLYVELLQGTPLLVQLVTVYFGLGLVGITISPWLAAGVAFTLNTSAFLGEIWRGCVQSIPRQQWEASASLGMTYLQQMRYIIVPQALRISVPPTVGYLVQVIKSTSLASVIGFVELTRAGQIINAATFRPFLVYFFVAVIYFLLCYPLTTLSRRLERNLHVAH